MRRRALLTTLPAVAGLAGCLDGAIPGRTNTSENSDTPDTGVTDTRSSTPDSTSVDVTFHAAIRYVHNDDSIGVDTPERDQFAFVLPPTVADGPAPESFALDLGGQRFVPSSSVPGFDLKTPEVGEAYTDDNRTGRLVFDVPTVDADEGALIHDGRRHPVATDALPAFAAAPDFSVRSVTAPASTTPNGTFEVTAEVANEGGRDGTFLAGVQRGGLFETGEARVEAGATRTIRVTMEVYADAGGAEFGRFIHADGYVRFEVPVETETESLETETAREE